MSAVHKARPLDPGSDAEQPCAVCWWNVKRVPGGQGPTWVHTETGAVAAPGPEPEEVPVVIVSFVPQAIVEHLDTYDEDDQARRIWESLTDEQKADAAMTCAGIFENDSLWEMFAEAIREGLTTYEREQL